MSIRAAVVGLVFGAWPLGAAAQPLVRVGPEFPVNEYTTGAQSLPVVAAYDGGFVVVWASEAQDGGGEGVFARRYASDGQPLGAEFAVNTFTTGNQYVPAVAAAADGAFVVAWAGAGGQDGHQQGVFARRFDATGAPLGAEFQVNTYTTSHQAQPSLAVGGGGFVVVWAGQLQDGSSWGVFGQRFDTSGAPTSPEFRVNTFTTGSQYEPSVTMDASGGFVVAWSSYGQDGDEQGIFGRRLDASGSPLGAEFRVNTFTTSWQAQPRVAGDAGGAFVVVWSGPGAMGGSYDVHAQRFDALGAPLGGEFTVNTYTTYGQLDPAIAVDSTGGFVVAWTSAAFQDGDDDAVLAQAFDPSGAPVGSEVQVNTYTTSSQLFPAIASGGAGGFVVAWQGSGQDGSNVGVFGQRLLHDLIFADGFESGSLSAWSAAAVDGGDLAVTGTAALAGTNFGLEGLVDDSAGLFVQDDTPDGESRYRARFYFDPSGFDPGEAQGRFRTRLFLAFEENPTRRRLALVLRRVGGNYSLRGRARLDDQSQADTAFVDIAAAPHFVEVDWRRSSGPDAADGSFEMWIDGVSVAQLPDLDNSASGIDFVRLGALSVKVGASGTLLWDEFQSRREGYIGP